MSAAVLFGSIPPAFALNPHATTATDTDSCAMCHRSHTAGSSIDFVNPTRDVSRNALVVGTFSSESSLCFSCHDGTGAYTNIKSGAVNSFGLASGHSLEATAVPADASACSACHDPHIGDEANGAQIARKINQVDVSAGGIEICLACHDKSTDWFGPGYPTQADPVRDASGYPVIGTWPGRASYVATSSAHGQLAPGEVPALSGGTIGRGTGDCRYCHASHGGANKYDGLISTYVPPSSSTLASDQADGAYAALCFNCHGGTAPSQFATAAPTDIKQFVTSGDINAGHRVKSAGGTLPVGAPLPCYECHDSHGTTRGNASGLADHLGGSLETSTDAGVRRFCFTCHTAADTGRGWDSTASAYATPTAGTTVVGLDRQGGFLRLPPTESGHAEGSTTSCDNCHGKSYEPGGVNVHNPTANGQHTAVGSAECQSCHVGADITVVHNGQCATCHGNPAYPTLPTGHTAECTSCHNATDVGMHAYSPADPNHYNETSHTPSFPATFTAAYQSLAPKGAIETGGFECSACHSASLKAAHATTSVSGGSVTCVECHTNTSLASTSTVAAGWPSGRCADCHDANASKTHGTMAQAHTVAPSTCADSRTSCHNTADLSVLHASSQSGGAPLYKSCANSNPADASGCHTVTDMRPAAFKTPNSCGAGSGGCHQDKTVANHAVIPAHSFTSASDYSTATASGCTNSGAGCHGTDAAYADISDYHPSTGCTYGACHTSSSFSSYSGNRDCQTCHAGQFAGAPAVTSSATTPTLESHYAETTHTANVTFNTVTAGGTASATCSNCHNASGITGASGLSTQHQSLPSPSAPLTCVGCHNANASVSTVVSSGWPSRDCAACHSVSVLPTSAQHGSVAATVAPTSVGTYEGRACTAAGCHESNDLHAIHRNAASCALSGCHDYSKQADRPSATSCGSGKQCHDLADPHAGIAAGHDASSTPIAQPGGTLPSGSTAAASCENNPNGTECHVVTDVVALHAGTSVTCDTCHRVGGPTKDCQAAGCHTTQYVNKDDHSFRYHLSSLISTAPGQPFETTDINGTACMGCHDDNIDKEHDVLSAYATTPCSMCHKKATDSTGAAPVTAADTTATVAMAPGTALCTDCHKTVTAARPHIQRPAGADGVQFVTDGSWSGHGSYIGNAGTKTSNFLDVPDVGWEPPAADSTWLIADSNSWGTKSMVSCDGCHGSVSGAVGPHGSSVGIMVPAGYATDWKTTTINRSNSNGMSNSTNICAKCHVLKDSSGTWSNDVHSANEHAGRQCQACHIRVPHAWKRPRLLGYTSDPAPYNAAAGGLTGISVPSAGTTRTATGWQSSDCSGCGQHSGVNATTRWP